MGRLSNRATIVKPAVFMVMVLTLIGVGPLPLPRAAAADLAMRSIRMSDATAAQNNVVYRVGFTTVTPGLLGSMRIQFCSNTSLIDDLCTVPAGFDATNAMLVGQGGATGFSISSSSTANEIILSRPPAMEGAISVNYNFDGITNPFTGGSYYGRILTYASSDATGPYSDAGGLALSYAPSFGVSTEVPPFLTFCVGENITGFNCNTATEPFSDLGSLKPSLTSAAQTQALVATNAGNGYSMWVVGTPLTSGSNVLAAMSGGSSQHGTSQFGMNLRLNTNPVIGQDTAGPGSGSPAAPYSQANQFRFHSGDVLATSNTPDDYRKYTMSYIVNVPPGQPGGVYSSTLMYICLANF